MDGDIRILIIEDNPADAELAEYTLRSAGIKFISKVAETEGDYRRALSDFSPDIIISDYDMPTFNGSDALSIVKELRPDLPFILYTGAMGEERAIEILTGGATDYVMKTRLTRLVPAVERALKEAEGHKKRKAAEAERDLLIKELESRVQERTTELQTELTERKRVEEDLRSSRQRLAAIFDGSPFPVALIKSPEGTLIEVNKAYEQFFECPRQEAIGKTAVQLGLAGDPDARARMYLEIQKKGFVNDWEMPYCTRSGKRRFASFNFRLLEIEGQKNLLGSAIDITDRKRAEEELRNSEERFRVAQELSPDGFTILHPIRDNEGHVVDFTWVYENAAIARLNGTDPNAVIGKRLLDLFPGHRGTSILEAYQQVAQTGESRVTEAMYQGESIPDPTWFRIAVVSMGVDIAILTQDITDRKRAEEALLKAKEELEDRVRERTSKLKEASLYARSLIEASLDPLVTISPEGKITDVNEATAKVTGVPRDQLIGSDFSDYFTEPGKAREGYQQVFKKGFVTDYPLTIRNSAGNLVDVLYNASLYRDILGNVLGVFAAARDVTEPKRVMREFAETKNFLDNILESSTKYSIIGEDFDHRILSWNEGARRNYGYTAEEIIGQNSNILHVQEDVKMGIVDRLFETAYERGLAEGEFQRVRKDGSRFIASLVVTRRNDAYGNPIGYLLISSDISEKKQAEEQIRQAAQYARSLIEASVDPLVTISTDGKITDVNRASEQVTGISRLQLIGSDFSDYFTEPERARVGYEKVFRDGFVRDYPLELKHRDGLVTPVLYNASVYRDETGGRILGVFAAARDITKRKEMEKEMLAVHRKLRAMTSEIVLAEERSRQRLAADLHDTVVQTIGAVKLRSQLIQDQIPRKARPIFTELQDMLTQSIAQARLIMAEMSPPVLYELGFIPAVEWLAEQIEDQHGIAIKFESENSIEPLEHEIKVLLFQATRELLMNIVKHAKSEGAVVKVSGNTDRVRIEVIDNGIGLDKKQAFRTDLSSGGFGLFSIRERLRHIGGQLIIKSEPGKGTRVVMTAPRSME